MPASPVQHPDATIACQLTAAAPGAIGVVALEGPRTEAILGAILHRPKSDRPPELQADVPILCRIVEDGRTLDDAIVLISRSKTPCSAEIHTHGGIRITQRLLMLLASRGAAVITQAEYATRTNPGHAVLRDIDRALLASQSHKMTGWLLAQREILPPFLARLDHLPAADRAAFDHRSQIAARLLRGISIALVGPPNAGKSTLANRLIGHERIITSDHPGTTRDWISETALINGWPVTLTDTAGLRDADCAIEREAIRRGTAQAHAADLVLIVLDATAPSETQRAALDRAIATLPPATPRIIVFNKCDSSTAKPLELVDMTSCRISAFGAEGIDQLESHIEGLLELDSMNETLPAQIPLHNSLCQ